MPYIKHASEAGKLLHPHGISIKHAEAFLDVAQKKSCLIIIRSPGPHVLGPVNEGYASKGYHNKAKTCNWGPMAGFVVDNPWFSKIGFSNKGRQTQQALITNALQHHAGTTPLIISDARVKELIDNKIIKLQQIEGKKYIYTATFNKWNKSARLEAYQAATQTDKTALNKFSFILKETTINNIKHWRVWHREIKDNYTLEAPIRALVDPVFFQQPVPNPYTDIPTHRRATTGDYDLFAVWRRVPKVLYMKEMKKEESKRSQLIRTVSSDEMRPVSATDLLSGTNLDNEYADSGNSKDLIRNKVRPALNRAFRKNDYTGGDMVHHSDEAGRPNISGIDFPVIAFFPSDMKFVPNNFIIVNTLKEFVEFYKEIDLRFHIDLNPVWIEQFKKLGYDKNKAKLVRTMSGSTISAI